MLKLAILQHLIYLIMDLIFNIIPFTNFYKLRLNNVSLNNYTIKNCAWISQVS